jgi:hypothetical protein
MISALQFKNYINVRLDALNPSLNSALFQVSPCFFSCFFSLPACFKKFILGGYFFKMELHWFNHVEAGGISRP